MSGLQTLVQNATTEELRTIHAVLQRADAKPAVVVTLEHGRSTRRYVVAQEDEHLFDGVPTGKVPVAEGTPASDGVRPPSISDIRQAREEHLGRFGFGGQWLRGLGRVDEMYRSLATWEVVKVERIDRTKVWGR